MAELDDDAPQDGAPVDPRTGRILDGRYRLGERLGTGGVGAVYRGTQIALDLPVAIKLLHDDAHPSFTQRFEREAKALAALRHPGIVSVTDYGVTGGTPYLVTELLEGETLAHRLSRGRMAPRQVMRLARELLRALDFVHAAGLVHRDLKPGNVFLECLPDGEERLKLLDFGLAKYVQPTAASNDAPITRTGHVVGTPAYIAPEQIGSDAIDARTDMYALGVMLFQMLCGRVPFEGEPVEQLKSHLVGTVPSLADVEPGLAPCPEIDAFLARAMAKTKDARFRSCNEMLEALEAIPQPWVGDEAQRQTDGPAVHASTELRTPDSDAPTLARAPESESPDKPSPLVAPSEPPTTQHERPIPLIMLIGGALGGIALLAVVLVATREPPPASSSPAATTPTARTAPPPTDEAPPISTTPVVADAAAEASSAVPAADAAVDAAAAPDATAPNASPNRAAASNPWTRGVPTELRAVRRAVGAGKHGGEHTIALLRRYNRANRTDPRGHLLLARLYDNRGWHDDAVTQLEFALRRDIAARGAPEVLEILLRRFAEGSARDAGRLIVQVYASEALPAIDRVLASTRTSPTAKTRLTGLRSAALHATHVWK